MRRLPVHTEAVDAGVFRVAPIAQYPELHQLVRAHGITLGQRKKEETEHLRALKGSETLRRSHFILRVGYSKGKALTSK